eukprot:scaffold17_cov354-Pavlova_lutheri.AAC.18
MDASSRPAAPSATFRVSSSVIQGSALLMDCSRASASLSPPPWLPPARTSWENTRRSGGGRAAGSLQVPTRKTSACPLAREARLRASQAPALALVGPPPACPPPPPPVAAAAAAEGASASTWVKHSTAGANALADSKAAANRSAAAAVASSAPGAAASSLASRATNLAPTRLAATRAWLLCIDPSPPDTRVAGARRLEAVDGPKHGAHSEARILAHGVSSCTPLSPLPFPGSLFGGCGLPALRLNVSWHGAPGLSTYEEDGGFVHQHAIHAIVSFHVRLGFDGAHHEVHPKGSGCTVDVSYARHRHPFCCVFGFLSHAHDVTAPPRPPPALYVFQERPFGVPGGMCGFSAFCSVQRRSTKRCFWRLFHERIWWRPRHGGGQSRLGRRGHARQGGPGGSPGLGDALQAHVHVFCFGERVQIESHSELEGHGVRHPGLFGAGKCFVGHAEGELGPCCTRWMDLQGHAVSGRHLHLSHALWMDGDGVFWRTTCAFAPPLVFHEEACDPVLVLADA